MFDEAWEAMTAGERADHLREALREMIGYQDAVIAELEARIKVLEKQTARVVTIDGAAVVTH